LPAIYLIRFPAIESCPWIDARPDQSVAHTRQKIPIGSEYEFDKGGVAALVSRDVVNDCSVFLTFL
jgi:hypothetical protein